MQKHLVDRGLVSRQLSFRAIKNLIFVLIITYTVSH